MLTGLAEPDGVLGYDPRMKTGAMLWANSPHLMVSIQAALVDGTLSGHPVMINGCALCPPWVSTWYGLDAGVGWLSELVRRQTRGAGVSRPGYRERMPRPRTRRRQPGSRGTWPRSSRGFAAPVPAGGRSGAWDVAGICVTTTSGWRAASGKASACWM